MKDGRLCLPRADDLDVARQAFAAGAEPHRDTGKASDVQLHGRALQVCRIDLLSVDHELFNPVLVGRDRQHVGDQGVVAGKVVGVAVT